MYVFMYIKIAANINFIKSKYENISDIFLKCIAFEKLFLKFHMIKNSTYDKNTHTQVKQYSYDIVESVLKAKSEQ